MANNSINPDGSPKIKNYEDAFNYIVRSETISLAEAAAMHVFHIHLRRAIFQYELSTDSRMTRDEIDAYIDRFVGAKELDKYQREAQDRINNYVALAEKKKVMGKIFPKAQIWSGVLGNFVSVILGIAIATLTKASNDNSLNSALNFIGRCIGAS